MEITKTEFYREKLRDEILEDNKLVTDFIKKEYDSSQDRYAKKNRDNHAQELRAQGYSVSCSRTISLRGRVVYQLWADKNIIETKEASA